jgi:RimJ/RimL family protein N-acetyltransferase
MDVPELVTTHLRLRGWRPDDLDAFAAIAGDPQVARYLDNGAIDRDEAAEQLDEMIAEWPREGFGRWAVEDRTTHALIGECGFERYDRAVGELTVMIDAARQGRGLGSEAVRTAVNYGFETLGFRRVVAVVHPANRAAQRLLEKIGMQHTENSIRAVGVRMLVYQLTELERRMRQR